MNFFDTTPLGRLINRFSKDINTIDDVLPEKISQWLNSTLLVISTLVVIIYTTPSIIFIILPLMVFYYFMQCYYICASRQLTRIEATTRSPIYNLFAETLSGTSTIRAFKLQSKFLTDNQAKVDRNQKMMYYKSISNRWLGTRLTMVGSTIVLFTCGFTTLYKSNLQASSVGLAITYAISIDRVLQFWVFLQSQLETRIVSVERVVEYFDVEQERQPLKPTHLGNNWPFAGKIEFINFSTKYSFELPLVIKNLTFTAEANEKIAIVGRSGAGKSSIALSIFRILEKTSGLILIDGIDISSLELHKLRSRLTIIPQDPVLWKGTVRYNLDPLHEFSDEEIYLALENSELKNFLNQISDSPLTIEVAENGDNFSIGQRQLFCLTRALLRNSKILIMDEATAAIDPHTDTLIQKTIKSKFKNSTVITIAHRLNTILDYDSCSQKRESENPKCDLNVVFIL